MKKRANRSYDGLLICVGVGLLFAGHRIVGSWLEHMFYVLGPGPTVADREAFTADLQTGIFMLIGAVVLGLMTTAISQVSAHTAAAAQDDPLPDHEAELEVSEPA